MTPTTDACALSFEWGTAPGTRMRLEARGCLKARCHQPNLCPREPPLPEASRQWGADAAGGPFVHACYCGRWGSSATRWVPQADLATI